MEIHAFQSLHSAKQRMIGVIRENPKHAGLGAGFNFPVHPSFARMIFPRPFGSSTLTLMVMSLAARRPAAAMSLL